MIDWTKPNSEANEELFRLREELHQHGIHTGSGTVDLKYLEQVLSSPSCHFQYGQIGDRYEATVTLYVAPTQSVSARAEGWAPEVALFIAWALVVTRPKF